MSSAAAAIVGVGGLGAPAAAALAAMGARRLTLVDPDVVELSNLPRQPLYGTGDVGTVKVDAAAARLRAAFPDVALELRRERLEPETAGRLLDGHAVVVDGTDSLASKVALNDAALASGTPLVHAGAVGLDGQLLTILPGRSTCLRCLFPELPGEDDLPTCQQAGILGPVVGAVGFAAAVEASRLLRGLDPALADRLAILDGARLRWRCVELRPNPSCPACDAAARAGHERPPA